MIVGVDHVGIAVEDLDAAVELHMKVLGVEPIARERVESQGAEEVLFRLGSTLVQLVAPLGPDTPIGRFLAKRGPGLHHIGYRVDDLVAELRQLKSEGVTLIDEKPRPGSRGTSIAFVHPKGMGGVLVELVQKPRGGP
jgi:methylmalonyl-CoA epimerase